MTMSARRHVLLVTDAFPPISGGSGWSTYELARGLRARGDRVTVLRPRPGTPAGLRVSSLDTFDGFDVHTLGGPSPRIPFVRNYVKNERLAPRVAAVVATLVRDRGIDIVHGQHLLSIPGAIEGAHAAGVPAVATIRDYWPVCYWSDLIHDRSSATLCPACSAGMMTRCVRAHAGAAWPLTLPAIPYMRANLRWKAGRLAEADAVIAVSTVMARDLEARAPALAGRVEVIPNPVDIATLDAAARSTPPPEVEDIAGPFAIYVGKLAFNKGIQHLIAAAVAARLPWPLVVVGDGPDRQAIERDARASGLDVRFTRWLDRQTTLELIAHASMLVFPSHGPESLSRVLLEAGGLGLAIAAMDTGGTRDVVVPDETGLLSTTPAGLAADMARLIADPALRTRLGAAARAHVRTRFATGSVVARIGALYDALIAERRTRG
jgi:glycosyltransferase involved in cell wall biosynthesis